MTHKAQKSVKRKHKPQSPFAPTAGYWKKELVRRQKVKDEEQNRYEK